MNWERLGGISSVYGRIFDDVDKLEEHGLLKGDPFYHPYTGRQASIVLNSLKPNWTQSNVGSPNSRRQSSARILIKIAFSDTMPQIPHNVLRLEYGTGLDMDVHLKALFPSDSFTALFEIPLRLWAAILPDSIETYFSIIRGDLWFPGEIFPTTQMLYHKDMDNYFFPPQSPPNGNRFQVSNHSLGKMKTFGSKMKHPAAGLQRPQAHCAPRAKRKRSSGRVRNRSSQINGDNHITPTFSRTSCKKFSDDLLETTPMYLAIMVWNKGNCTQWKFS
jgi:hypothetical protein